MIAWSNFEMGGVYMAGHWGSEEVPMYTKGQFNEKGFDVIRTSSLLKEFIESYQRLNYSFLFFSCFPLDGNISALLPFRRLLHKVA